jgi:hypothetical protein
MYLQVTHQYLPARALYQDAGSRTLYDQHDRVRQVS